MINQDTIIALATPSGMGAIAIIRLSETQLVLLINFLNQKLQTKAC